VETSWQQLTRPFPNAPETPVMEAVELVTEFGNVGEELCARGSPARVDIAPTTLAAHPQTRLVRAVA
jgi:hypothetical protein